MDLSYRLEPKLLVTNIIGIMMVPILQTRSIATHYLKLNLGYTGMIGSSMYLEVNLTDEEYYTSLVNNLPTSPGVAGSPRVIGLSISKEF